MFRFIYITYPKEKQRDKRKYKNKREEEWKLLYSFKRQLLKNSKQALKFESIGGRYLN